MEKIPEYVKGNILPAENLNFLEITSFVAPPIVPLQQTPHVCNSLLRLRYVIMSVLQNRGKGEKVLLMISSP